MTRHELADAMIRGEAAEGVVESQDHYLSLTPNLGGFGREIPEGAFCAVCAIGAAVVGSYDGNFIAAHNALREKIREDRGEKGEYDTFAELLDISPALAVEIEFKHLNGESIEQIAAWLKSSEGGES